MTLKEDAESLSLDVQDAEQNVASYEQQADSDEAMIEEVGAPLVGEIDEINVYMIDEIKVDDALDG